MTSIVAVAGRRLVGNPGAERAEVSDSVDHRAADAGWDRTVRAWIRTEASAREAGSRLPRNVSPLPAIVRSSCELGPPSSGSGWSATRTAQAVIATHGPMLGHDQPARAPSGRPVGWRRPPPGAGTRPGGTKPPDAESPEALTSTRDGRWMQLAREARHRAAATRDRIAAAETRLAAARRRSEMTRLRAQKSVERTKAALSIAQRARSSRPIRAPTRDAIAFSSALGLVGGPAGAVECGEGQTERLATGDPDVQVSATALKLVVDA
jgi:hypothetical protein